MQAAVLGEELPGNAYAWDQGIERQRHLGQAGVARRRCLHQSAFVLFYLGYQATGRPGKLACGQRLEAASVDKRRHLDDVVRGQEGHAGTVAAC